MWLKGHSALGLKGGNLDDRQKEEDKRICE
jgi:hypothetical protein